MTTRATITKKKTAKMGLFFGEVSAGPLFGMSWDCGHDGMLHKDGEAFPAGIEQTRAGEMVRGRKAARTSLWQVFLPAGQKQKARKAGEEFDVMAPPSVMRPSGTGGGPDNRE